MKIQNILAQSMLPISILTLVALSPLDAIAKPLPLGKIPGTTVELAPPEGFQPSKFFPGFEQPQTGATILVTEMPIPNAESAIVQLSSAQTLKTRGMELIESKDMTIDGRPAKLLLVAQSAQGIKFLKWIVVMGVGDRALLATAAFPEPQAATLKEPLRQSMLQLRWTTSAAVKTFEGLTFNFKPVGDLEVSGRILNAVVLTRKGAKTPLPAAEPIMVLGSALTILGSGLGQITKQDLSAFSRLRLQQTTGITGFMETSGNAKTLAGLPAFELVATGYDRKTRVPLTVYQTIIVTDETYYILQGIVSTSNAKKYLPMFRAVANSFNLKPSTPLTQTQSDKK
jgi:hypothetical protein